MLWPLYESGYEIITSANLSPFILQLNESYLYSTDILLYMLTQVCVSVQVCQSHNVCHLTEVLFKM